MRALKAPFPWFGGKSRVADLVWERFGNCPNYVEPFAGSLAVLLGRPHEPKNETVNDKDAYLSNFWRALAADPELVAQYADWPVNEADLHARHQWLVDRAEFREKMLKDPEFFDARVAGWWVWGISQWIGSGWCTKPQWTGRGNASRAPRGVHKRSNNGVHRKLPRQDSVGIKRPLLLKKGGTGVNRQLPDISGDGGASGRGINAAYCSDLGAYFYALHDRLRRVRVCCGDWARILGPSPTTNIGLTGVFFLDPPYSIDERSDVYNEESRSLSHDVAEWAIAHGDDPKLRIALCGYAGEHEFPDSWECLAWKSNGGYGNQSSYKSQGRENAHRERIWVSPHCLRVTLFTQEDQRQECPNINEEIVA